MKITYLGTAAYEGFPALFCNCEYCVEARRLGGKNIRTRSQSLIDDDLLVDFPADTYFHFLQNGIEGDKIKYLLVTHSHCDHLYVDDIMARGYPYAHNMRNETLKIFCSETASKTFKKTPKNAEITVLKAFETVNFGRYSVTALPARHMPNGEPFIYVIKGDKTVLYAHDTGYFYEEVFDFIDKNGIVFDLVSFDCTCVDLPTSDESGHMGFANIDRVLNRLASMSAIRKDTVKVVNHFSHNGGPLHHVLEERAREYGCTVSYDGCKIEF